MSLFLMSVLLSLTMKLLCILLLIQIQVIYPLIPWYYKQYISNKLHNNLSNNLNNYESSNIIANNTIDIENKQASFTLSNHKSIKQHLKKGGMRMRDVQIGHSIEYSGPSSYQLHMKWNDTPKRVLFLVKKDIELLPTVIEAITVLLTKKLDIYVETSLHSQFFEQVLTNSSISAHIKPLDANISNSQIDFVITFGGDGLLMHCNTLFGGDMSIPPIMCFDFGSLGFLAPFKYADFEEEVDQILAGHIKLTLRMRLDCKIYRNNTLSEQYTVLNEAVIDRGPSPFLTTLDLACDSEYLTTVQGDGIIIATPTGSTAYSLAAGGSMVHPSIPAILITPICAHTLSFRPLILPDSSVLTCFVPYDARGTGWVCFDGKYRLELQRGERMEVKMSPYPMPTMNRLSFTGDWFGALRSQFMFNLRPRQKGFSS